MAYSRSQIGVAVGGTTGMFFFIILLVIIKAKGRPKWTPQQPNIRANTIRPMHESNDIEMQRQPVRNRSSTVHCRSNQPTQEDNYEQYGELHIGPHQKPVCVGLDIITRLLIVFGLPSKATHSDASPSNTPATPAFDVAIAREPGSSASEKTDCNISAVGPDTQVPAISGAITTQVGEDTLRRGTFCFETIRQHSKNTKTRNEVVEEDVAQQIQAGKWSDVAKRDLAARDIEVDPMSFAFGSGKAMAKLYK